MHDGVCSDVDANRCMWLCVLDADPPEREHGRVMIEVQKRDLMVVLAKNKDKLQRHEKKRTVHKHHSTPKLINGGALYSIALPCFCLKPLADQKPQLKKMKMRTKIKR